MTFLGNALIGIGVSLILLAGIGIVRLPDVFSRMHAGTKAASLGLALVLSGSALLLPGADTTVKLLLAVAFQFGTSPVSAHVIGRAAYRAGVEMWETHHDDLAEDERDDSDTIRP